MKKFTDEKDLQNFFRSFFFYLNKKKTEQLTEENNRQIRLYIETETKKNR